jgi:hypothetical protein
MNGKNVVIATTINKLEMENLEIMVENKPVRLIIKTDG